MRKKIISIVFTDLENISMKIELFDSYSPKTFEALIGKLPLEIKLNRWGEELYSDPIPINTQEEKNSRIEVNELDVAYWSEGKALCFFFGPTPISKNGQILTYSPVNIIGKVIRTNKIMDILKKTSNQLFAILKE